MTRLIITAVLVVATRCAFAEVEIIKGGESDKPAGEHSTAVIHTRDRDIVPAQGTTKETKTGLDTGRSDTITRLRDINGSYFEWQRASAVSKEVAPGKIERTTEVVELDRQGGERQRKVIKQMTEKTGAGERANIAEYRRDSGGGLVVAHAVAANTAKNSDGTSTQTRTESDYDVNGRPVVTRQLDAVTKTEGNKSTTTTTAKTVNHLDGNVGVDYREIATMRTEGNTTRTEALRQKPAGAGWEDDGRTVSTQTRSADGTIQRETIVETRSLYARQGGRTEYGELVPQTKTVDREVRQPDGTVVIQRDFYRRDVNGDWTPTTFSTEGAQRGY
jgi:hypothetical protein